MPFVLTISLPALEDPIDNDNLKSKPLKLLNGHFNGDES
jgi:hypothetical protein